MLDGLTQRICLLPAPITVLSLQTHNRCYTHCLPDPAHIPKVADQHQVSVMLTMGSVCFTSQQSQATVSD